MRARLNTPDAGGRGGCATDAGCGRAGCAKMGKCSKMERSIMEHFAKPCNSYKITKKQAVCIASIQKLHLVTITSQKIFFKKTLKTP
jgi:hypothetical protein